MKKHKVLLLSECGHRFFSPNMQEMSTGISNNYEFFEKEMHENNAAKLSPEDFETEAAFCNKELTSCDAVYCTDVSILPEFLPESKKKQARILVAEPYEYLFKVLNKTKKKKVEPDTAQQAAETPADVPENDSYAAFTHIYAYSKFWAELIAQAYQLPVCKKVQHNVVPGIDRLNNPKIVSRKRRVLEEMYPQIKDRKILSLLSTAQKENNILSFAESIDLKRFLDEMPSDWVFLTNMSELEDLSASLPSSYANRFLFVSRKVLNPYELLYTTDVLLSDVSYLVCTFASTQKPFYAVEYLKGSQFFKYTKKKFPELIFDVSERNYSSLFDGTYLESHEKFRKRLSCLPSQARNSSQKILDTIYKP